MLKSEISIRQSNTCRRKTSAWFVTGTRAEQWLAEIGQWDLAHHQLRLIVVPKSKSDLEPIGVLVFGFENSVGRIKTSPRCIPFGQISDNLYLPVDAKLVPFIRELESTEIFELENLFVWHPSSGLIATARSECLRVSQLLTFEPESFADWSSAESGIAINSRLRSIQSTISVSVESIIDEGRDGIGERSGEVKWTPPPAPHPNRGAGFSNTSLEGNASQSDSSEPGGIMSGISKAVGWAANLLPKNSTPRRWVDNLKQWAYLRRQALSQELYRKRNEELFKLMEMLENDPDQGLKFALPMSGDSEHRGLANPSDKLTKRNVDFDFGGMGGGRAADHWDVPVEIQLQLTTHYRELAEREIRLGRHRRAAYIYAELLGDVRAAAKALENGRHWREAATIYQKRLMQIHESARCLKEGGLWTEAIEIYTRLKEHETAGDLYLKIDQREEAMACFEIAAETQRTKGDFVNAARIEEVKIEDIDLALVSLSSGFQSSQAVGCMREIFRIHACHGQHAQAMQRIEDCRNRKDTNVRQGLVQLLVETAKNYPDRQVKRLAADTTRWIVSDAIGNDVGEALNIDLLTAIGSLAPEDRLLGRDCRRIGALIRESKRPPLRIEKHVTQEIELIREFSVCLDSNYQQAVGLHDSMLAIDLFGNELAFTRFSWSQGKPISHQAKLFTPNSVVSEVPKLIVKAKDNGKFVAVRVLGGRLEPPVSNFVQTHEYRSLSVGQAPHDGEETLGIEPNGFNGWGNVRWVGDTLVLDVVNRSGQMVMSKVLCHREDIDFLQLPVPIYSSGSNFYVAVGNRVFVVGKTDETIWEFDQPVIDISGSIRGTRTRIAFALERGVEMFWDSNRESTQVCREFENPKVLFTRTGHLVVATTGKCHVFATRENQVKFVGEVAIDVPVSLMRADESNRFAILNESGKVSVFQIPTNVAL